MDRSPDPQLIDAVAADIAHPDRDAGVVQAAATAVARAIAGIDPVFISEASEKSDGSLRVDVWESAMVQFEDLLPEDYQEAWEQESGASWQVATSGPSHLQDVLAAAVNAAVLRLG
ncbi:MAG: hypothetical protein U0R23_02860 [Candidatus Nanopelagicales bacterium]